MKSMTKHLSLDELIDGLMAELARAHTAPVIRIPATRVERGEEALPARSWRDRALTAEAELAKFRSHRDRRLEKYNRFRNEVRRLNRAIRFEKLVNNALSDLLRKQKEIK